MVRSRQSRIKNYFAESRLFTIRSIVAGVIAAVLLLAVAGRLFYLQVLKFDYYSNLSQGNSIRNEPIPPSRGLILDRHGVVLADNFPAFNVELVREQVGDSKALDATLAQLVSIGLLRSEEVGAIRRTILVHKVYESVPIKLLLNEAGDGVVRGASLSVHRRGYSRAAGAPLPAARNRRPRHRLCQRHQRTRHEADRQRRVRGHQSHRQTRRRRSLRGATARQARLPRN